MGLIWPMIQAPIMESELNMDSQLGSLTLIPILELL